MTTNLRFSHIGMGHVICANRVLAIMSPQTKSSKRYTKTAKDQGKFLDATVGRVIKSVIVMDDGTVINSCIKPRTLLKRFMESESNLDELEMELEEEDEEDITDENN